ncbi:Hypothetical Protein FCC1311_093692 [Hondaea fermentalgiana]|uniref:Uncharacterized protein n=1 Tax=Hondaea fermentalgiana TaxID=2315210 RepID=A0A2R5GRC3_9STRA|nr:Hypothetical Protein FCC1311_093692 [Hondaea fermentalgiana]|eukprot:GBG33145.1 Hypothetical Protein FCC1311_093692 [Hondaea fermentalgiana]
MTMPDDKEVKDDDEELLLRFYNGTDLEASRNKPLDDAAYHVGGREGNRTICSSAKAAAKHQRTKGLPRELRKAYHGCKAGKLNKSWNLASHGGITHRTAVCVAAQRAHAFREHKLARSCTEMQVAQQRGSLAEAVLVGALMQAREILREKKRDIDTRLADAIAVLQCAERKGARILLKEADNLWRLSMLSEEEDHRKVLECEAQIKSNLAGVLSKSVSVSCSNTRGSNPGRVRKQLQNDIQGVLRELVAN